MSIQLGEVQPYFEKRRKAIYDRVHYERARCSSRTKKI